MSDTREKHVEISITIQDRATVPNANGGKDVFNVTTFKAAGVGGNNLGAFQQALAHGGAEFLEKTIGLPGLALLQVGMKPS